MDFKKLANQYKDELMNNVLPFWLYLECRNNPKQPKISKYKPLFIRIF